MSSYSSLSKMKSVVRYLLVAHASEPDDEMDAEEECDGVVAFGDVLLNIALKDMRKVTKIISHSVKLRPSTRDDMLHVKSFSIVKFQEMNTNLSQVVNPIYTFIYHIALPF